MKDKENTLNISKIKKQAKRNNINSFSRNDCGFINISSSSNRFKCRR